MGPEVLNPVQETVVVKLYKDVIGPTNFVSCFLELNCILVDMGVVLHLEAQEFGGGPFGVIWALESLWQKVSAR